MQQNCAFHFYPTLGATPQQVRFPHPLAEADAAVITMSRYMIAQYVLLVNLVHDARMQGELLLQPCRCRLLRPLLPPLATRRHIRTPELRIVSDASSSVACCLLHVVCVAIS